jgi:LPXTG-motif cell wall-anchored protein
MGVEIGDKPSLSTGAKAGIALGAVLGFALIAGAIAVLVLRKRKKAQVPRIPQDVAEMPSHSAGLKRLFRGKWRAEMDGDSQPVEIDSRKVYVVPGPPAELEAPQHELSRSPSVAARQ